MTTELEVAYLGVQVADPAGFDTSLHDIVGLVHGEPTADGATTWRNDDRVHRLIVEEGPANDAVFAGLEASSPEAFVARPLRRRLSGFSPRAGTSSSSPR